MVKIKITLFTIFITFLFISCNGKSSEEKSINFAPPEWSYNSSIYEVNIRQYTPEGTFNAFSEHLPKLKKMGVGIIWLMPIHPIGELNRKGTLGSYYSVKDYKGINPNFGTETDFRNLVHKAHDLGMHVIIDWVANHTALDHPWTKTNKDYYTLDSTGNFIHPVPDWSDVIDLNYDNTNMRLAMIDALKYWVREFGIDGYRCDVASMVPNDFWFEAFTELNKLKQVFMLAESDDPELHKNGFHMTYGWKLLHLMNNFAKGENSISDFFDYFKIEEKKFPKNAFRMNFTTNHDENSWNGTVFKRYGKLYKPLSVLISTAKGMPLVYSGQEAGLDKALDFFEKDPIEWKNHPQKEIFTILLNEKIINKALWNGERGGEMNFIDTPANSNLLAFYREKEDNRIVVILNLSDSESRIKITSENLLGGYTNLFNSEKVVIDTKNEISLPAYGYKVLKQ